MDQNKAAFAAGIPGEERDAMQTDFRTLEDGDIEEAVRIFICAYARPPWNEDWTPDLARLRLNELIGHPGCLSVAVVIKGDLAGFAFGTPYTSVAGRSLYLAELVVAPARQRQGLGKALLDRLEKNGLQSGYGSMWLVTERTGTTRDFYSKSGFRGADHRTVLSKRFGHAGR